MNWQTLQNRNKPEVIDDFSSNTTVYLRTNFKEFIQNNIFYDAGEVEENSLNLENSAAIPFENTDETATLIKDGVLIEADNLEDVVFENVGSEYISYWQYDELQVTKSDYLKNKEIYLIEIKNRVLQDEISETNLALADTQLALADLQLEVILGGM